MALLSTIKRYFPTFKYTCSSISVILFIWLFCHLFIRSCGGPFPQRTRGPLARYEHYKLGDFHPWERFIQPDGKTGLTPTELLIQGKDIPPVEFGKVPPSALSADGTPPQPKSAQ